MPNHMIRQSSRDSATEVRLQVIEAQERVSDALWESSFAAHRLAQGIGQHLPPITTGHSISVNFN